MALTTVTTAKVARLIAADQVALNRGADTGVLPGDLVTLTENLEITDPDTKEFLGFVLVPKLLLRVTLVAERYAVARVIDQAPPAPWTTTPRTKSVTSLKAKVADDVVLVEVGEEVLVEREDQTPEADPAD